MVSVAEIDPFQVLLFYCLTPCGVVLVNGYAQHIESVVHVFFIDALYIWKLAAAWTAPACPKIEQDIFLSVACRGESHFAAVDVGL